MITEKKVTRYFADYLTAKGKVASKGFGSKASACRFHAKQALFDHVFGRMEEYADCPGMEWEEVKWRRNVPDDEAERLAKWQEAFPSEECDGGGLDYYGNEYGCSFYCESHGYARCQSHKWMFSVWQSLMFEQKVYDPRQGLIIHPKIQPALPHVIE